MGVVAKNPISKLMPVPAQQVSGVFLDDSATPIRIMYLKEALPAGPIRSGDCFSAWAPAEGGRAPSQIAGSTALDENPATSELGKLLRQNDDATQGQECRKRLSVR